MDRKASISALRWKSGELDGFQEGVQRDAKNLRAKTGAQDGGRSQETDNGSQGTGRSLETARQKVQGQAHRDPFGKTQVTVSQGPMHDKEEALVLAVRTAKMCLKAAGTKHQLFADCFTIGKLVGKLTESTQGSSRFWVFVWPNSRICN